MADMAESSPFRREIYRATTDIVRPVADSLGLGLSPEAMELQRLAIGAVSLIDTAWDNGENLHGGIVDYVGGWVRGDTDTHPTYVSAQLANDMNKLRAAITRNQAQQFLNLGLRTVKISAAYKSCADINEYVAMRAEEASLTCDIMTAVVPDAERAHPAFSRYAELSAKIAGVGGVIDAAQDLRADYPTLVKIPPTLVNHIRLWWMATTEGFKCSAELGPALSVKLCLNGLVQAKKLLAARKLCRAQWAAAITDQAPGQGF
jgi:hypothetical protein